MERKYVIAHDVGTSSNKAGLIDIEGNIVVSSEEEYGFTYPNPGWVEQNPEDYWKAIVASTKSIIKASDIKTSEIIGIVFTTQAMGIIPIDKQNNILYNNITWVDGRAEKQAKKLMIRFLGRKVFKSIVGIELTGKDVIPKLMWLKETQPELYKKTEYFLDVNGFLKYKATGKKVAEWSGACSYAFNLKKKDWERIFFKLAGIDTSKLPPLVRSVDKVGGLTKEAAAALGLEQDLPVFGGCDDTQSAAIGTGAIGEGEGHIYLGTSAWVGVMTERSPKFKNNAVCLQSADPDKNLVVGITESAGANLEWLIERFYSMEKNSIKGESIYYLMDLEANDVPPGSDHLIFTPWLLGERCPVSTTTTRGTIYNLSLEHKRGHFVRALSEGIAYNLRWIIENYEKDFSFKIPSLRITGGGSQNDHWMQIFADVTKRKIITTTQPKMAGAIGAAMCAFVGAGILQDFNAVQNMVGKNKEFLPNPENFQIYDELFIQYKSIYSSLKKNYKNSNSKRFTK
ncbi:MAG: FGGY-family carbohydrate kinase [Cyclobacteriaceae bacterium]|nr:FGGY-family carbohydrate kinase [Cyclobacteriaceae bacterium]